MNDDELIPYLREQGYRLTPQRRLIIEVLQQTDHHLSVDEIAQHIITRYPSITVDPATIYRTLKWLRDAGLASETSLGENRMVYVLLSRHNHHHHLVCERCHAVIEADPVIFDAVRTALQQRYGFTARMEHLAIFGVCAGCAEQDQSEP